MVYVYDTDECEIPFLDWTHRKFSEIPKATYPANGHTSTPESGTGTGSTTGDCDCGDINVNVNCGGCADCGGGTTPEPTPTPTPEPEPTEDNLPIWLDNGTRVEVKPKVLSTSPQYNQMTKNYTNISTYAGDSRLQEVSRTPVVLQDTTAVSFSQLGYVSAKFIDLGEGNSVVEFTYEGPCHTNIHPIELELVSNNLINRIIPQDKVTIVRGTYFDYHFYPIQGKSYIVPLRNDAEFNKVDGVYPTVIESWTYNTPRGQEIEIDIDSGVENPHDPSEPIIGD